MSSAYDRLPGEDGWPLLGSIPRFSRDPLGFLVRLRREHGPVARFRMANLPYVLVSDPAGVRTVTVEEHERFEKHEFLRWSIGDALGRGLLVAEGDQWRTQRRIAQPSFRPKRIRRYAPAMVEQTRRVAEAWRAEPERELHEDMSLLTLRIVAEALFDVSVDERADEIGAAMDAIMERFRSSNRLKTLLPQWVPLPSNLRYRRNLRRAHSIVEALIDERVEDPRGEDLLGRLIRAYRDSEVPLDRERLRDELMTFMTAGHETTALALTWTLRLLGNHPNVQDRLARELRTELPEAAPDAEAVEGLDYLDAVVDEAMRLYPPVWIFGRQAVEDVEVAGRRLPEGTQIVMSQWVVHRHPGIWEDPERFDPDRWLDGRADDKPAFAHFPFGGGPRTCIGDTFAMQETRLALASLVRGFEVAAHGSRRPDLAPSITLRPGAPVRARVRPRED